MLGATANGQVTRTPSASAITIQLQNGIFRVAGWKAPAVAPEQGWASVLKVYAGSGDVPAMVGNYAVEGDTLVFRPQFPLSAGAKYRAVFQAPGGAAVTANFDGPPRATVAMTRVEKIYPSTDVLPSNELKMYIYFSAPMSRDEAWEHIRVLSENGKPIANEFLELKHELWDANVQRLTLWFDPGRIKRGLTGNLKLGPPIEEGKRYTLVIDKGWHDARGVPLVEGYKKTFRGGPADRVAPDPMKWQITAPKAGTTEPFIIDFGEPMDYAGLQKTLSISDGHSAISGTPAIGHLETQWTFTPKQPWRAGGYQLLVNSALEDLAANKIGQLFDMDVFDKVTETVESKTYPVAFSVK
jgi:hypothetical protein